MADELGQADGEEDDEAYVYHAPEDNVLETWR